jgi:beta-glucanase (GH16 family)
MNRVKLLSEVSKFSTIGILSLVLVACGGGGGGGSAAPNAPISDTTPPVITLVGAASVNHEQGTTYTDEGATASDTVDGTLSVSSSGNVGTDAGTYTITYSASDAAGNTSTATRTVIVADTQPPTITLTGESEVSHEQGTDYVDAGATATDVVDDTVPVTISGEVGTELGDYTLTFTATDTAGNSATETRTVTVIESGQPQAISLSVFDAGQANVAFDAGLNGADSGISWGGCSDDGGDACPNLSWAIVQDADRGDVLQIEHSSAGQQAIFFIKTNSPMDLSAYSTGSIIFDLKTISGDSNYSMKIDCVYPCTSGDKAIGSQGTLDWETVTVSVAELVSAGLQLVAVDTGIVIWATAYTSTIFQLDNIRWEGIDDGSSEPPIGGDDGWEIPAFTGYQAQTSYEGYSQVWSDEFSGTEVDSNNWGYDIGGGGWGNNELEFYTNRNAYLKNGQLVIRANQENYGGRAYTSSRLKTQAKQNFQYGRIDIRAVMPEGQGIWPALWMLGENFPTVGWPHSGEIDVMEMIGGEGRENRVYGTAHWYNQSNSSNASYGGNRLLSSGETLSTSFHVYSIEWDSTAITWYLDDVQFHTMTIDNSASLAAFRKEFFFIFNIAVGGNWPGNPNSSTVFPQRMIVDYVRVFQKN